MLVKQVMRLLAGSVPGGPKLDSRTTPARPVLSHRLATASGGYGRVILAVAGLPLLGASWALIWTQDLFWNPLFFWGMWVGATLIMYALGTGYPGWRRHAVLAVVSLPVWWWFELVNERVGNWEYIEKHDYSSMEYFLLASLAFSTVVPALHSAWGMTTGSLPLHDVRLYEKGRRGYLLEAVAGVSVVFMTFALPGILFPLVWVGPFLFFDGVVGHAGGRSLLADLYRGQWRLAAAVGLAGLTCGFLWEFWNFWSTPKWAYHIPYLDYLYLFEMPLLGYLGYIPFAWSVYQLLHVTPLRRYLELAV